MYKTYNMPALYYNVLGTSYNRTNVFTQVKTENETQPISKKNILTIFIYFNKFLRKRVM